MNIVLHQPEIPANTGNIGRTCVATGSVLHLIEPLGFRLNEKEIKRAGMDYWKDLDVRRYVNYEEFLKKTPEPKYGWQLQRPDMYILMFPSGRMTSLCSARKVQGFRKKFWWIMRIHASGFPCWTRFVL